MAILLVSLLAVVINCYPVVFCGRSYVSPTSSGPLVYAWWPPLPGMGLEQQIRQHDSDTAAMMVWGVPAGFVESRSLLEHGEIPLWNRYGHAGETLIGQAVSMLGDPLQLIVIFGHGCAAAWDIKYLAAKFLFCVGFGWLVLRLLGNQPLSLLYAALAAYCGAFFFINNHPVFFVFSYAPWILLAAIEWLELRSDKFVRWALVWLLANFACFNGGHVEPAVVLIGGLNLAAVAVGLARCGNLSDAAKVLGRMAVGTLLFLGLTAPMWVSFLVALDGAYSAHLEVKVFQLPLLSLPGMFDDEFYQLLIRRVFYSAPAPGTSLFVMAGCLLSVFGWRCWKSLPFFWVNSAAILLWTGCAFKLVPAGLLAAVPLLNRVGHTYTDFSYLLVIHLTLQSAYGFAALALEPNRRRRALAGLGVGLVFGVLLLAFWFATPGSDFPWRYFLVVGAAALAATLLCAGCARGCGRLPALAWVGLVCLGLVAHYRFGLYHAGNENLQLLPGPRRVLDAPSQSLNIIKADVSGPFRVVGMDWNFFGNYAAVYGLEDVRSCAPLSNPEFIRLLAKFPGMEMENEWMIRLMNPVAAQPLLNLLNVKYVLTHPGGVLSDGLTFRLADRSDFAVLENQEVWPRAFFTDRIFALGSNEEFIKLLSANETNPFIALTPPEIATQPGLEKLTATKLATVSPATNYQLLPNSTAFDVHAALAGVVCLTESQARDFTALVNGETRSVLTVNRCFKGVYLDKPGDYHIVFTYRPRYWRQSCAAFWLAVGSVIALVLVDFFRARNRQ